MATSNRAEAPTQDLPDPGEAPDQFSMSEEPEAQDVDEQPAPPPQASVNDVFTFALRVADLLLRNGASSASVTRSMLAIARIGGYPATSANVTMGQITLSYLPDDDSHPVTRVQNVGIAELDLRTLQELENLVESVVIGERSIRDGLERIAFLEKHDRSPRHLRMMGAFTMAAGFAWLLGGGLLAAGVAAVVAVLTEGLNGLSARITLPTYYARALSSGMAVCAAALVTLVTNNGQPGVVIAASLVTQLAGGASVSAIQDLLTGWLLTATGRLIEAALLTVGLVIGAIGAVLGVGRLGIHLDLHHLQDGTPGFAVSCAAAGVITLGFALYAQSPIKALVVLTGLGVLTHAVFGWSTQAGISALTSTGIAAMTMGVLTVVLARPLGWPASGALDTAVVPLLPGMALYEGLTGIALHDDAAAGNLFQALTLALGIGTGAVLGQFLAGRVLWGVRRGQLHLRERRSGEVLARQQFEAEDLTSPDFRRPFIRSED